MKQFKTTIHHGRICPKKRMRSSSLVLKIWFRIQGLTSLITTISIKRRTILLKLRRSARRMSGTPANLNRRQFNPLLRLSHARLTQTQSKTAPKVCSNSKSRMLKMLWLRGFHQSFRQERARRAKRAKAGRLLRVYRKKVDHL